MEGAALARGEGLPVRVHGRHVDVTPALRADVVRRVSQRLAPAFANARFLEAEGGVAEIDVRLMNSQAEVTVRPRTRNARLHDSFLRQGHLTSIAQGAGALAALDAALDGVEARLKVWTRAPPCKRDYHHRGRR